MHTISLFSINSDEVLPILENLIGKTTYPTLVNIKNEVFLQVGNQGFILRDIKLPAFNIRIFPRFIVSYNSLVTGLEKGGRIAVIAEVHDYAKDCSVVRNLKFSKWIKE